MQKLQMAHERFALEIAQEREKLEQSGVQKATLKRQLTQAKFAVLALEAIHGQAITEQANLMDSKVIGPKQCGMFRDCFT